MRKYAIVIYNIAKVSSWEVTKIRNNTSLDSHFSLINKTPAAGDTRGKSKQQQKIKTVQE